jgi:hypothetical protein
MDKHCTVRINPIRPFPSVVMSVSQTFTVERFATQNLFQLLVARRKSVIVARRKTKHIFAAGSELTEPERGWAYEKLFALEGAPLL